MLCQFSTALLARPAVAQACSTTRAAACHATGSAATNWAGHQNMPSHHAFAHGFMLEVAHIDYFYGHYLRCPADRNDWRFAPLDGVDESGHVRDLEGVAPAWIGLAECDPLADEGIAYADRLRGAHVPVDLEIYRGVVHGFINLGRAIPEALTAHGDAARALRHAFQTH